jgi:DNA-binding response OmpR family regulator
MAKVLIVDDDPNMCVLLSKLITKIGHQVFTAANGKIAESMVPDVSPDVILMDYLMPFQDGCVTSRNLREQKYNGCIVILSALQSTGNDPATCGANGFLRKPVDPDRLFYYLNISNAIQIVS